MFLWEERMTRENGVAHYTQRENGWATYNFTVNFDTL